MGEGERTVRRQSGSHSLEFRFFVMERFRQLGVVYDELFERDPAGRRHSLVDIEVLGERHGAHVLGFVQHDFEHAAVFGAGFDMVVHAVDGQPWPGVFRVNLLAKDVYTCSTAHDVDNRPRLQIRTITRGVIVVAFRFITSNYWHAHAY